VPVPVELTFRGMAQSEALTSHVQAHADQLEHLFDRIVSCHVTVEPAQYRQHHEDRYHVSVTLGVPGREILVKHRPSGEEGPETAYDAVDRAFEEATRELEAWLRHERAKHHEEPAVRPGAQ